MRPRTVLDYCCFLFSFCTSCLLPGGGNSCPSSHLSSPVCPLQRTHRVSPLACQLKTGCLRPTSRTKAYARVAGWLLRRLHPLCARAERRTWGSRSRPVHRLSPILFRRVCASLSLRVRSHRLPGTLAPTAPAFSRPRQAIDPGQPPSPEIGDPGRVWEDARKRLTGLARERQLARLGTPCLWWLGLDA